ncbi:MAG: regulatory iron-sulfur-containing complex subunit RicT [Chloroflexi bacterium]|nr:regulatory iron-sulfur-containing complex subunit RicT [Chloroflexota bacterium]
MNNESDDSSTTQTTSEAPSDEPACTSDPQAAEDERVIIGIRIREASRIYHFSAPRGRVFMGDYVVVDRARGDQLARVVTVPDDDAPTQAIPRDVRPIVRIADGEDRERASQQAERADQILQDMRSTAVRDDLGLYPVAIELNLEGDRGTAWFQAPDHVDFRQMLDDVQDKYDVRLHMQQANQRERASLVDGYDICGLRLCCSSWMTDFPHVGIRVAKDQDLSLNPDSISGVCGRLLCCLTFEHEVYREMRGSLPRVGKRVSTPAGMGKVIKLNVLQQKVTIALDDHPQRVDVPADEIGLAVRTEEAPNQALVDAERYRKEDEERAAALRQAAAPAPGTEPSDSERKPAQRRKRRRSRKSKAESPYDGRNDESAATQSSEQQEATGETSGKRSSRRRRRRKAQVVNQQQSNASSDETTAPLQRPDGDGRRSRRGRRRSRRAVNQPGEDSTPSE